MIKSIIKIESIEATTAVLAALPTPVVPLLALYPWYPPIQPMAKPNNAAFIMEALISKKVTESTTSPKYNSRLVLRKVLTITNEPKREITSAYTTRMGRTRVVARTRETTRYEKGREAETSIASICSVTRMLPNSAPIFEPNFPAQISPVIKGPRERTTACETREGNHDSAPKDANDGWDCLVKTMPAKKEVKEIRKSDFTPIL